MIRLRRKINEEGVSSGSGGVAGLGVDAPGKPGSGEPGVSVSAQMAHQRKNKTNPETPVIGNIFRRLKPTAMIDTHLVETTTFAGNTVHIVPSSVFHAVKDAKKKGQHWRTHLTDSEHAKVISAWARKNNKKPVVIQDERTGAMVYARYGKK